MKKYIFLINMLMVLLFASSCQKESMEQVGYLRLSVNTNAFVNTPTTRIIENYNPKTIAIQILNAAGTAVVEATDYHELGDKIALAPGQYTVVASSNGFDGMESGFDIPYFVGSKKVVIESEKNNNVEITCTLANVKVTVNFDEAFKKAFKNAKAVVSSAMEGVNALDFVMNETTASGYFPVADLTSTIHVTNQQDKQFSQAKLFESVQPRDHYILNYKVAETGGGNFTVKIDGSEKIYTFTFNVSTEAGLTLNAGSQVNAWSKFAEANGVVKIAEDQTFDSQHLVFEYKLADESATEWTEVTATSASSDGKSYKARFTGLTPDTEYEYRMRYVDEKEIETTVSKTIRFTTESAPALRNGDMDSWTKESRTWYLEKDVNDRYWDSSNPGTTKGAGFLVNLNPTTGDGTIVHTPGGQAARLESHWVSVMGITKFAAASLYTGSFGKLIGTNGAQLNFGQPFTARPSKLHGFFQYAPKVINRVGNNLPAEFGVVKDQTMDLCSAYILLTNGVRVIDNTQPETLINGDTDEGVIAFGELPVSEAIDTNGEWKEFNIDLKYRNFTEKPTHIIVVFSSSKYGDYFTGGEGSVMYVDDVELIYDENPILKGDN